MKHSVNRVGESASKNMSALRTDANTNTDRFHNGNSNMPIIGSQYDKQTRDSVVRKQNFTRARNSQEQADIIGEKSADTFLQVQTGFTSA